MQQERAIPRETVDQLSTYAKSASRVCSSVRALSSWTIFERYILHSLFAYQRTPREDRRLKPSTCLCSEGQAIPLECRKTSTSVHQSASHMTHRLLNVVLFAGKESSQTHGTTCSGKSHGQKVVLSGSVVRINNSEKKTCKKSTASRLM